MGGIGRLYTPSVYAHSSQLYICNVMEYLWVGTETNTLCANNIYRLSLEMEIIRPGKVCGSALISANRCSHSKFFYQTVRFYAMFDSFKFYKRRVTRFNITRLYNHLHTCISSWDFIFRFPRMWECFARDLFDLLGNIYLEGAFVAT